MNREDLLNILNELNKGFLEKKIHGTLYSRLMEGLICTNLEMVPELENFADWLALYHPEPDPANPELFRDADLIKEIKRTFKM